MIPFNEPPIVRGGQGREDYEVRDDSALWFWLLAFAGIFVLSFFIP